MRTSSKSDFGADRFRKKIGDIAYYKLFMLNLHAAIDNGFKLENIFQDLRQKCDGEYIFGRAFIADTIIDIVEKLDSLIFYINSLSGGRDVDLFYKLDHLKNYMNRRFGGSGDGIGPGYNKDGPVESAISLPDLLKEIMDFSTGISFSGDNISSVTQGEIGTVHDLLIYCYKRFFEIIEYWFQTVISADKRIPGEMSRIIRLPISYLLRDGDPVFDEEFADVNSSPDLYSNPGASKLCEGIYEVYDSELYSSFLEKSGRKIDNQGMLLYSNETLALYHVSNRFKNIVAANICDAVGGNYINLLVTSASPHNSSEWSHRLFGKLLDWLDFHSFSGYNFTIASIGNMTRNDTENQLNILGKLLAFTASTAILPHNEKSVQENIDLFLENIV
jgi:hypothetical protein